MDRETRKHAATVRQMSGNGMSQREIAAAVGVSVSTVNRILRENPKTHGNKVLEFFAAWDAWDEVKPDPADVGHDEFCRQRDEFISAEYKRRGL